MYYLGAHLAPLSGEQVFGWRVAATLPLTTWWLIHSGQASALRALLARVRAQRSMAAVLPLSAALLGAQLWLFMWAPLNGYGLAVSLGFALLPLGLVLAARVVFQEKLTRFQQLAAILAALGIGWELVRTGGDGLAWPTWAVLLGYTLYFVLRRRLAMDTLAGHWVDMALLAPIALMTIFWVAPSATQPSLNNTMPQNAAFAPQCPSTQNATLGRGCLDDDSATSHASGWAHFTATPRLWWALPLLGVLSAGGLGFYMIASARLPLGLFGLLSYLEPILLIAVSWWLGERIAAEQTPMYALIAASVATLTAGGLRQMRHPRLPP